MKTIAVIIACISCSLMGCVYYCDANDRPHCADLTYPSGPALGPCNTSHTRWFYVASTNECEKRTYWGCYGYGFGSESECEECRCNVD